MPDAKFRVIFAGPHVSFQDQGRFGNLRFGVPASGPMDRFSFDVANVALGNSSERSGIEVSSGGLVLECLSGAVTFCVAGGGFSVDHNGTKVTSWTVRTIYPGEKLSIRAGEWGSWTYLNFAGVPDIPRWLGCNATHAGSGFGGGKLSAGQEIVVQDAEIAEAREGELLCPDFSKPTGHARVVLGPQDRHFAPGTINDFLSTVFVLSDAYDRMGVRLKGVSLSPEGALSIPSEPVVRGSIQVSGDAVATVLLADHGTTGGYPKIATVISSDLDRVVQLRSRETLSFTSISAESAVELGREMFAQKSDYFLSIAEPKGTFTQRLLRENLISGVVGDAEI